MAGRPFAPGYDERRAPPPKKKRSEDFTVRALARRHQGDAVSVLVSLMGSARDKDGQPLPGAKDEKVRLAAAKTLLEYAAGTPIPMTAPSPEEEAEAAEERKPCSVSVLPPMPKPQGGDGGVT